MASRQHGVVTRADLEAAGINRSGISRRVRSGQLHRIHRGVYAVGHRALGERGCCMAAVLAYGACAVISHQSAAQLWGFLPRPELVHLLLPGKGGHRSRPRIRVHHSISLVRDEVSLRWNIPVTNPSRTLVDLRRTLPRKQFAAALRQAEYLGLPIGPDLDSDHTRSELERRFLALCRRHRLPRPEVNARIGPFIVDFLWSPSRLIVEVDGFRSHRSRSAFERDRARDVELKLRGYEVLRFTWLQLADRGAEVAAALRRLLS